MSSNVKIVNVKIDISYVKIDKKYVKLETPWLTLSRKCQAKNTLTDTLDINFVNVDSQRWQTMSSCGATPQCQALDFEHWVYYLINTKMSRIFDSCIKWADKSGVEIIS